MGVKTKSLSDEELIREIGLTVSRIRTFGERQKPLPRYLRGRLKGAQRHFIRLAMEAKKRGLRYEI